MKPVFYLFKTSIYDVHPVDCEVGDWSTWSECSATCGNGTETRNRNVTTIALHQGKECPHLNESQVCHDQPCPGEIKLITYLLLKYVMFTQLTVKLRTGQHGANALQPAEMEQKQETEM